MLRYIGKRLLMMIPVMLGVSLIVFCMVYFTPGDPAQYMLGADAAPETIQQLREELGLNRPFWVQYLSYIKNIVLHGDLGTSYTTHRSVTAEILDRFPNTLRLAGLSIGLATVIGITTGIIAATKQYSIFDNLATVFALTGISMPNFWTGLMLIIVFALHLGWFPPSGFAEPKQWVLPVITVGLASTATIMRQTRSSMLEVIRSDYITTARANGQTEGVIVFKHALRNALIPVITVIGIQFGTQLGGAIMTEAIYSIPGVGKLMVDAISMKNYPMVQGGVLFLALCFSLVNLAVDILYAFIDPRIRSQYSRKKKASQHAHAPAVKESQHEA